MTDQDSDEDFCLVCTSEDCDHCNVQSEIDRMLGIFPYNESANFFAKDSQQETQQTAPPPAQVDEISKEPEPAPSQPPPAKKKPGAPKGNLNAVKHGIYISSKHVSNTTPMERAKLADLNQIIENVKTYINKVYENGLTLKTTEEMNDTLKKLSSASIALTRLLHTHNALMFSSIPYKMSGDTRASTQEVIDYYHDKVDLYSDLTNPVPEPDPTLIPDLGQTDKAG